MASYKKYQTKKGTKWKFQLFMGRDPHGKQIIKTRRGFDTKKEASIAAAALEKQLNNESLLDDQYLTFNQVYTLWLENYKLTVKESTSVITEGIIKCHILPIFRDSKINDIDTKQCQEAINKWFNVPLKNYRLIYNYLSRILQYSVTLHYSLSDPTQNVIIPNSKQQKSNKPENKLMYYDYDQLKTFLECASSFDDPQYFVFFRLLAFTGLRKSEATALVWNDINFEKNSINISKTLSRGHAGIITQTPKTINSKRKIYIDGKTTKILKHWRIKQQKRMLILGYNTLNENQLVFSSFSNKTVNPGNPRDWMLKITKKCGLPLIPVHGFRHTYATLAIQGGMTPKELQNQLGHKDIKTTLNIYTSVTNDQMEAIPDKFTAFVNF